VNIKNQIEFVEEYFSILNQNILIRFTIIMHKSFLPSLYDFLTYLTEFLINQNHTNLYSIDSPHKVLGLFDKSIVDITSLLLLTREIFLIVKQFLLTDVISIPQT